MSDAATQRAILRAAFEQLGGGTRFARPLADMLMLMGYQITHSYATPTQIEAAARNCKHFIPNAEWAKAHFDMCQCITPPPIQMRRSA